MLNQSRLHLFAALVVLIAVLLCLSLIFAFIVFARIVFVFVFCLLFWKYRKSTEAEMQTKGNTRRNSEYGQTQKCNQTETKSHYTDGKAVSYVKIVPAKLVYT